MAKPLVVIIIITTNTYLCCRYHIKFNTLEHDWILGSLIGKSRNSILLRKKNNKGSRAAYGKLNMGGQNVQLARNLREVIQGGGGPDPGVEKEGWSRIQFFV